MANAYPKNSEEELLPKIKTYAVEHILANDTLEIDFMMISDTLVAPNTVIVKNEPRVVTPNYYSYVLFISKNSKKQDFLWVIINPENYESISIKNSHLRQNPVVSFINLISNIPFKHERPEPKARQNQGLAKTLSSHSERKYAV